MQWVSYFYSWRRYSNTIRSQPLIACSEKAYQCVKKCKNVKKAIAVSCRVECMSHLKKSQKIFKNIFDCGLDHFCLPKPPQPPTPPHSPPPEPNCNTDEAKCSNDENCQNWRDCISEHTCAVYDVGCLSRCTQFENYKPDNTSIALAYCSMAGNVAISNGVNHRILE